MNRRAVSKYIQGNYEDKCEKQCQAFSRRWVNSGWINQLMKQSLADPWSPPFSHHRGLVTQHRPHPRGGSSLSMAPPPTFLSGRSPISPPLNPPPRTRDLWAGNTNQHQLAPPWGQQSTSVPVARGAWVLRTRRRGLKGRRATQPMGNMVPLGTPLLTWLPLRLNGTTRVRPFSATSSTKGWADVSGDERRAGSVRTVIATRFHRLQVPLLRSSCAAGPPCGYAPWRIPAPPFPKAMLSFSE